MLDASRNGQRMVTFVDGCRRAIGARTLEGDSLPSIGEIVIAEGSARYRVARVMENRAFGRDAAVALLERI